MQGHTQTLWRLLTQYKIPTFLFVNKMDQEGTDRERLLEELKKKLSGSCVDFSGELECSGAEAAGKKENPVDNSGKSPSAKGCRTLASYIPVSEPSTSVPDGSGT